MDISKYQELFKSEAAEILQTLNNLLVQLEKTPASRETLNEIFRMAHTLKGMAATMNYPEVVKLSHEMESMLDTLRINPSSVDQKVCTVLFEKFDALKQSVAQANPFTERRMVRINEEDKAVMAKASREGIKTYIVKIVLHKDCTMPQARSIVILKTLQESGKILNEAYVHNQIKTAHFGKSFIAFYMTKNDIEAIKKEIRSIQDVDLVDIGPMTAEESKSPAKVPNMPAIDPPVQGIRVSVERLDNIFNLVGELNINKTQLETIAQSTANTELSEHLSMTHRLISELQMEVTNARLFPLSSICDQFPRMVRDMAKSEGKEVNLEIIGAEIGLDRVILDEIKDPLIHILRNCVGHGIEIPDIRRQKGKQAAGLIKIQAKRENNRVSIEVTDDGNGMDIERIKNKAVSMGLITLEKASCLSDQETAMLTTVPGLSTACQVTEISGRGVGMDIVKMKVEHVAGTFLIETRTSIGCKFIINLPVSLAIIKGLMVKVHHQIYGIPVSNIVRIIIGDPGSIKDIPLVSLREVFGFKNEGTAGTIPIVIVKVKDKTVGLMVDGLVNQQEMIVKTLDKSLARAKGLSGATILGSGKVALIVDVPALV
jgi:two-component system chemotaxis sensor kinase CheA